LRYLHILGRISISSSIKILSKLPEYIFLGQLLSVSKQQCGNVSAYVFVHDHAKVACTHARSDPRGQSIGQRQFRAQALDTVKNTWSSVKIQCWCRGYQFVFWLTRSERKIACMTFSQIQPARMNTAFLTFQNLNWSNC